MAGQKSHHVTVGVYDWNTEKTVYLQTGEPKEQYLTNISWTPDEQYILIAVVNRDQNEMKLNQYRVSDGSFVKTLFTESDPQWVEPENPAVFIPGKLDQFVWQSERNGFNQLYHYNLEGKLIQSLCPEKMIVTDFNGFDQSGKEVFVTVSENDGLQRAAWRISLKGKANKILMANGVHRFQLNRSGNMMLDEFGSAEIPKISAFTPYSALVRGVDGRIGAILQNSEDPTLGYNLPKPSIVQLQASDGSVLNGRLYMPKNMNPNQKYPVVIYLYGGPHAQMVTNSWMAGGNLWMSWMASQGYAVFTLDNRGSANRGLEFEQAIHRNLGEKEMEDQLVGADWLKKQTWVNPARIGVHGWSFGGFMTTTLLCKKPGMFKAGVAGGPVIDWSFYEVMYTERYMDTPKENPEGFKKTSLINDAAALKDRLMLIHGTIDDVVVWQHSQRMVKACVDAGVLVDYMIYPGHPHNVSGKDRLHLYKTISRYLMEHLREEEY
jgi:dipeptidyl-peptidase-4